MAADRFDPEIFYVMANPMNYTHKFPAFQVQKNPSVHKISVRNSGAGNGCANFMGTWKNGVLSAGKPMSINFLVLGGGGILGFGGGGEVPILFLWAQGFF